MRHVHKKLFPRVQFLKKFLLYDGLAKYHLDLKQSQQSGDELVVEQPESPQYESHDLVQSDLMSIFNCDTAWPICLFDFTIKSKCPNYFIFRVQTPLNELMQEDYFYSGT